MPLPLLAGIVVGALGVLAWNKRDDIACKVKDGIKDGKQSALSLYNKGYSAIKDKVEFVGKKTQKPKSTKKVASKSVKTRAKNKTQYSMES